jgi:cold shock CspA family protein
MVMIGTVVRYNEDKGYGFIAPDGGEDDDVFVHANELTGGRVRTGTRVEFEIIDGERGLKAYNVRVIEDQLQTVSVTPGVATALASVRSSAVPSSESPGSDAQPFKVLSESEFLQRMTELLLESGPQLTGAQINELRKRLLEFASKNSWVN